MPDKIAEFIFEKIICRYKKNPDGRIVKKLRFIHPCDEADKQYRDFCIKRIRLVLIAVSAGIVLSIFTKLNIYMNRTVPDNTLERNEWNGKDQKIELSAYSGEQSVDVDLKLETRELSVEEIEAYSEDFETELPELILGDNPDLMHVSSNLCLKEKYDGYPFECVWRSSDPGLVRSYNGEVSTHEEGAVRLTVKYSLGDYENSLNIDAGVCKPEMTDAERLSEEINENILLSERNERATKEWILPDEIGGKKLRWEYRQEDNSTIVAGFFAVVALVLYMAPLRDLDRSIEKKKKDMRESYPKILREMSLYVGAGMTVKSAFKKIASEGSSGTKDKGCIYEEMHIACLEMGQGVSEGECYERFGNRTGLGEYIKFAGLISQNLRRGNTRFKERLREEANYAMRERVLKAKRAGEEAQTKMLAPMVMMLAVVMVMIMIPAMTGINI